LHLSNVTNVFIIGALASLDGLFLFLHFLFLLVELNLMLIPNLSHFRISFGKMLVSWEFKSDSLHNVPDNWVPAGNLHSEIPVLLEFLKHEVPIADTGESWPSLACLEDRIRSGELLGSECLLLDDFISLHFLITIIIKCCRRSKLRGGLPHSEETVDLDDGRQVLILSQL